MKKQSILFTFAISVILSINFLSFYSCSTDDFEEEYYTLSKRSKTRGNEVNRSGNLTLGNVEIGVPILSDTKTFIDYFRGGLLNDSANYRYEVEYTGTIYEINDTANNHKSYAASLFYSYFSIDDFFSVTLDSNTKNEIYFKANFNDEWPNNEEYHQHSFFGEPGNGK